MNHKTVDILAWFFLALFVVGIYWAFQYDSKQRRLCEAKGGVYITGDSVPVCIDKKSVLK